MSVTAVRGRWAAALLLGLVLPLLPVAASGQNVAETFRRPPASEFDPFVHVALPGNSLLLTGAGGAENSALSLADVGALTFLAERDSLRVVDAIDALGLVPRGDDLAGGGEGAGGLRLGVAVTDRLSFGLSLVGGGYGSFRLDGDAVALLRDGNADRSTFALGETRATALATGEAGVHAYYRAGRLSGPGGPEVDLGLGARVVRPLYFVRTRSLLRERGTVRVTTDSVRARLQLETYETPAGSRGGRGLLGDLLVRFAWPGERFALEAGATGVGTVELDAVERRRAEVDLATTRLDTVAEVVENLELAVVDTVAAPAAPPGRVHLAASWWPLSSLQLDTRLTATATGDFDRPPPEIELLGTWRPVASLPLRGGVRAGGRSGGGVRLGAGYESRRFVVRGSARSTGGVFSGAKGIGGRLTVGVLF